MTRAAGETGKRDPWRSFVTVAQIPDNGLHRDIEADQAARSGPLGLGRLNHDRTDPVPLHPTRR